MERELAHDGVEGAAFGKQRRACVGVAQVQDVQLHFASSAPVFHSPAVCFALRALNRRPRPACLVAACSCRQQRFFSCRAPPAPALFHSTGVGIHAHNKLQRVPLAADAHHIRAAPNSQLQKRLRPTQVLAVKRLLHTHVVKLFHRLAEAVVAIRRIRRV